jgi:hypothetical protein
VREELYEWFTGLKRSIKGRTCPASSCAKHTIVWKSTCSSVSKTVSKPMRL